MSNNTICSGLYNKAWIGKGPHFMLTSTFNSHGKSTKCRLKSTKVLASTRLQMPGIDGIYATTWTFRILKFSITTHSRRIWERQSNTLAILEKSILKMPLKNCKQIYCSTLKIWFYLGNLLFQTREKHKLDTFFFITGMFRRWFRENSGK